jgi:hypothetical protein
LLIFNDSVYSQGIFVGWFNNQEKPWGRKQVLKFQNFQVALARYEQHLLRTGMYTQYTYYGFSMVCALRNIC